MNWAGLSERQERLTRDVRFRNTTLLVSVGNQLIMTIHPTEPYEYKITATE